MTAGPLPRERLRPGIEARAAAATHPIVDLVPTLYRWLGLEPDPAFAGQPIPELVR